MHWQHVVFCLNPESIRLKDLKKKLVLVDETSVTPPKDRKLLVLGHAMQNLQPTRGDQYNILTAPFRFAGLSRGPLSLEPYTPEQAMTWAEGTCIKQSLSNMKATHPA